MIDHLSLEVADYERSKTFYAEALAPLGYELLMELDGNVAGFGVKGKPDFWVVGGSPSATTHVAFASPDRANYYGAYVQDPDGHNVEAVCHSPE